MQRDVFLFALNVLHSNCKAMRQAASLVCRAQPWPAKVPVCEDVLQPLCNRIPISCSEMTG